MNWVSDSRASRKSDQDKDRNQHQRHQGYNTQKLCNLEDKERCSVELNKLYASKRPNWIGGVLKSCSTYFRLYNDVSSFIGGGRPQHNSDLVEPPSLRKLLETFPHKVFGASEARTSDLSGETQVTFRRRPLGHVGTPFSISEPGLYRNMWHVSIHVNKHDTKTHSIVQCNMSNLYKRT